MCERRLLFELESHPQPEHAMKTMVHRIMDVARRSSTEFVTCAQLGDVCNSVGEGESTRSLSLHLTALEPHRAKS